MSKRNRKWRNEVKKLQRKRRRSKAAQERDRKLEQEEEAKLKDPAHQEWLIQQASLEHAKTLAEEHEHALQEEHWLRQELLSQREFNLLKRQRAAAEAVQEAQRLEQEKELAAREAEKQRLQAVAAAEFEQILSTIEKYLSSETDVGPPANLDRSVETRPGQKLCELYHRTNCCRFSHDCVYNHRRPLLANIILIHHFFVHPALEQKQHAEYACADAHLEMSENDLRTDYDEFFNDVVPELERFGHIRNFRVTRNTQRYLSGHVFVEYTKKRSALKAFINLQGRYYAARRLNVEFSNITSWRSAVCGLSLTRKCAKGHNCNYLHLFRNPGNKYNTSLEATRTPVSSGERKNIAANVTPLLSWNDVTPKSDGHKSHNWRWSESPEIEIKRLQENVKHLRGEWECNRKDRHCKQNEHSKERDFKNKITSKRDINRAVFTTKYAGNERSIGEDQIQNQQKGDCERNTCLMETRDNGRKRKHDDHSRDSTHTAIRRKSYYSSSNQNELSTSHTNGHQKHKKDSRSRKSLKESSNDSRNYKHCSPRTEKYKHRARDSTRVESSKNSNYSSTDRGRDKSRSSTRNSESYKSSDFKRTEQIKNKVKSRKSSTHEKLKKSN